MFLSLASGKWVYLYAFQDVGNRRTVGWQVGARCLKNCGQCFTTGSLDLATGAGSTLILQPEQAIMQKTLPATAPQLRVRCALTTLI
jgi:hypothetical protein